MNQQELAQLYSAPGWLCNYGFFSRKQDHRTNQTIIQCLCPPSYYGDRCEFISDRITVHTQFQDQGQRLTSGVVKVLALLISKTNKTTSVVDHHEFHYVSNQYSLNPKNKFYLVYPRPHKLRSNTIQYEIRFEAFHLHDNETIRFLAVWLYPVPFNFLPSQRIAKILQYPNSSHLSSNHTCSQSKSPCLNNGVCHPILNRLNDSQSFWCECQSNSYGSHCQFQDDSCSSANYCSSNSLCRAHYDHYGQKPKCVCSIDFYGPRCFIPRQCRKYHGLNPCLNGGTCFTSYHGVFRDYDEFICRCPNSFYGERCEYPADLFITSNNQSKPHLNASDEDIFAIVIQQFLINLQENLILVKQLLFSNVLPPSITLTKVVTYQLQQSFGLVKFFMRSKSIHYYLLYTNPDLQWTPNITLSFQDINHCRHTRDIFKIYNKTAKSTCDFQSVKHD